LDLVLGPNVLLTIKTTDTLKVAFAYFDLPADQDCLVIAFKVALESNFHIEFRIFGSSEGFGDGSVCSNLTVRSDRMTESSGTCFCSNGHRVRTPNQRETSCVSC
jgi:hypothetical protein